MRKKMMKALKDLNAYIDNDREKLCDELNAIKLSHKRMERLLRRYIRLSSELLFGVSIGDWDKLTQDIKRELSYPYFRVQYRMKGVKKCVDV